MIIIIVVLLCVGWMIYEYHNAEELPPDFDYDKFMDDALKNDSGKKKKIR